MARHRTRRTKKGGLFGMTKKPLSSLPPPASTAPVDKVMGRDMGALGPQNQVSSDFRKGSLNKDDEFEVSYQNPMAKRAGRRKTRRTTRKSKKVARRR